MVEHKRQHNVDQLLWLVTLWLPAVDDRQGISIKFDIRELGQSGRQGGELVFGEIQLSQRG